MVNDDLQMVRQRCQALLQTLELPAPFDLRALCDAVEMKRRRPIVLLPVSGMAKAYGLWIAYPDVDVIFYTEDTSPLHRLHIIVHELSHLICDHQPVSMDDQDYLQLLCPDLFPNVFRRLLPRATYGASEDREAEVLASLILTRTNQAAPVPAVVRGDVAAALERLSACLERKIGGRT